jgi:transcriptional regulator with XRE-family HTH domain
VPAKGINDDPRTPSLVPRPDPQTKVRTRLAASRVAAGLTQEEMAWATGIPIALYVRLERGQHRNPRLGWLVNAAIVLDLSLDDVMDEWMADWYRVVGYSRSTPPPPEWRSRPEVLKRAERYRRTEVEGSRE